jgi:hypothetical protein
MTKLTSTLWASVAAGLMLAGTAAAQSTPDTPDTNTNPNTGTDNDAATEDSTPSPTTTDTTNTTPSTTGDATLQGQVSGSITTPSVDVTPPPPAYSQSTDFVVAPAPVAPVYVEDEHPTYLTRAGVSLAAGGGASGFTNDALRNTTNVGGDWDVRATVGTRSPIAFEGSYIGSAQQIKALGLDDGAVLMGNGVQGALRLNATTDLPVQPFIFAGAAWRRYDLTNTNQNLSDVQGSDDVLEVPMGAGIAAHLGGLVLDVRGEFRASAMEDLMPETAVDSVENATDIDQDNRAAMNRWGAKATIGVEF